ncbi:putative alanine racemase-domain-containing protein [Fomitopsis serialis]|uniref:putative alanine racemase-domain-containing protein n=1 Tax=Fomitopsis serialis TaxID=139415 RepID=UPI0020085690|nr:putative alanine racemase-domain-containing protein [Neoantrodia serialis]KAH9925300.1 putative alanine racemase-domain-containing protein [Neoantrodia serialis]
MVSAYRVDSLKNPTLALQDFHKECSSEQIDSFPRLVSEHYSQVFGAPDAFNEIPTLDIHNPPDTFPDRALVRFRAMVQDTSTSSEMYLSKSRSGACGGWAIEFTDEEDGHVDFADLRECTVLWAVSIPAESAWCAKELDGPVDHQERVIPSSSRIPYKPQHSHKYPHPSVSHLGVQVKIYDAESFEKLKTTDLVTFVGILTNDLLSSGLDAAVDVPTLHVLFVQQHPHNLLSRPYPSFEKAESSHPDVSVDRRIERATAGPNLSEVRSQLIDWIAEEALDGDRDAAEWVLLACIARVQSRNPPLLPPSLNLAHFPSSPPVPSTNAGPVVPIPTLSVVLAELLTLTHTLPLSLPLLNKDPFAPESKDEDLHSGALQLPQGTVLLVTEDGIQEGRLVDRGVLNVRALQEVMTTQTLSYAFPFSAFSFPTDIACIILSEGSKSAFFKASFHSCTDINIPLRAAKSPQAVAKLYKPAESITMPDPERLAAFRDLIAGARSGRVQVNEETSEHIQQDFVRERQQNQSVTSDDLIRRMTVAKLYALSMHETTLSIDVWELTKAFDERRRGACASNTAEAKS